MHRNNSIAYRDEGNPVAIAPGGAESRRLVQAGTPARANYVPELLPPNLPCRRRRRLPAVTGRRVEMRPRGCSQLGWYRDDSSLSMTEAGLFFA